MGCVLNVGYEKFPEQGTFLNKRCKVCFNYDTEHFIKGTVVRDDIEEPFRTIIKLDDGRYIFAEECQFSPFIEEDQHEKIERFYGSLR